MNNIFIPVEDSNIAHKCVESWKYHNPSWKVNKIKKDQCKYKVLEEHGGLYLDPYLFCNKSLDEWLPKIIEAELITTKDERFLYLSKIQKISNVEKAKIKVIQFDSLLYIIQRGMYSKVTEQNVREMNDQPLFLLSSQTFYNSERFLRNSILSYLYSTIQTNIIYMFWVGEQKMSATRKIAFEKFKKMCGVKVVLVQNDDVTKYMLPEHPLHPAYQYLCNTHKSDYLRAYFMHFYGGGYADIKHTTGTWKKAFYDLAIHNDYWICGYHELPCAIFVDEMKPFCQYLIGTAAIICKPRTPLTQEWYDYVVKVLDEKLELLKQNPAKKAHDALENGFGYPVKWHEMLGHIFHDLIFKHKNKVLYSVPQFSFEPYR